MARIRTIKPDFFRHENLQDLEAANPGNYIMLVFAALWGHCDKAGHFVWKPRTLKLDILPFLDFDMSTTLNLLTDGGFIRKYAVNGKEYGEIPTFAEHQRVTGKEAQEPAKHPGPNGEASVKHSGVPTDEEGGNSGEALENQSGEQEGKGKEGERKGVEASARSPKGSRLPPDWQPSESDLAYARKHGVDADIEAEKFSNHWVGKSGKDAIRLDWSATWRNWVLNEVKFRGERQARAGTGHGKPSQQQSRDFTEVTL